MSAQLHHCHVRFHEDFSPPKRVLSLANNVESQWGLETSCMQCEKTNEGLLGDWERQIMGGPHVAHKLASKASPHAFHGL